MLFPERTIKSALKEASRILMDGFGSRIEGRIKENQSSIVTDQDVAAEKAITHLISRKYPDHGIIGEEKGAVLTGSPYTWIIDPIDGTSNYASGIPWFGTLIAVLENDRPYAAGAYLPYYDLLYYAERGKGTYRNGTLCRATSSEQLRDHLFAYSTDWSGLPEKTKMETDLLKELIQSVRNFRSTNCLVDFCYVADGRLGGCLNHATKIWDIIAPYLLVTEAGGKMTHLDGSEIVFDISSANYDRNYSVFATGSGVYEEVLDIVRGFGV
jgi:myo-inositol-1(or 4)-monophosphatase